MKNLDMETLQTWLAEGRSVTVLDIRADADRAEWFIPNSLHVNAYEALKLNDPHALAHVALPPDVPVVTVCGAGKVSLVAAEQLAVRGFDAYSLAGGMKGWSLAWNSAEVTTDSVAQIIQLRRAGKGCLSYIIGSAGEAAVIDASLPPEVYVSVAQQRQWQITKVIETHVHADHLSRSRQLAEAVHAALMLPKNDRASFVFTPINNSDSISIGAARLTAMHTPGHTWESTSYLLDNAALFTGDTLFPESVGRPDLHVSSGEAQQKAHALYQSLQYLSTLAPNRVVLSGHTSVPPAFDHVPISARLGDVVQRVSLLREPEERFVETLLARVGATPGNYLQIVGLNEMGTLPSADMTELEAGANRCAVS